LDLWWTCHIPLIDLGKIFLLSSSGLVLLPMPYAEPAEAPANDGNPRGKSVTVVTRRWQTLAGGSTVSRRRGYVREAPGPGGLGVGLPGVAGVWLMPAS
jgi:hypothetical protein